MASVIRTASQLALPSSVVAAAMTDPERIVASMTEVDLWLDPAERPSEISALTLRDRARGLTGSVVSGTLSAFGGTAAPALAFANAGYVSVPYAVPASYFMACAVQLDTLTDNNVFATSNTNAGQRLFFGVLGGGTLRLDHGTAAGQNIATAASAVTTGTHVMWASYDAPTGAAEIGLDAVTAAVTGNLNVAHKGSPITHFFGSSAVANYPIDGKGGGLIVCNRFMGGNVNYSRRSQILAYLAGLAGSPLNG